MNLPAGESPWAIFAAVMTVVLTASAVVIASAPYADACDSPKGVDNIGWIVCPVNAFIGNI